MTRIPTRTREQAALICAIAASTPADGDWINYGDIAVELGFGQAACNLASGAWMRAFRQEPTEVDAEAEALLRCGWSPGDEP